MTDLSTVARRAVEAAVAAGAGDAEAYVQRESGRTVRAHAGEVESLTAAVQSGLGIRAWIGHRAGYAYGTDLTEAGVTAIAARAAEAAEAADEDEFAAPPRPDSFEALPGLSDPSLGEWQSARVAELAIAVERAALESDPRLVAVETAVYADADEQIAIASSTGVAGEYGTSSCYAYLQALAEGDGVRETGLGFALARGPRGLDPEAIGREGARRALEMVGAGKPASRSCPVVLEETVAANFVGLVGSGLSARAVQRGRSPFVDRLEDEVASEAFALHDDGRIPEGSASAPFDGEGMPRRRTPLIEGGRLRSYLYDTYSANREAGASTGSASRNGYRSLPTASASNLVVAPGSHSLEQLLAAAGEGIYVTDVAGLHSGVNPVTGVFSVGASGRVIRAGALAEPVREFTIAGELVAMLGAVRAAGADSRWVPFGGSVSTPPLLIAEMAISGS